VTPAPDAQRLLAAARYRAQEEQPYLAAALYKLRPVAVEGLAQEAPLAMAVDEGWRLFFDPEAVRAAPAARLAGDMLHVCYHLLHHHAARGRVLGVGEDARKRLAWNVAADLAVNGPLRAALKRQGAKAWPGREWLHPEQFKLPEGRLPEEYFAELLKRVVVVERPAVGRGGCGGCCGTASAAERAAAGGDEMPAPVGEEERRVITVQVAMAVRDHAKSRGTAPAGMERWAEEVLGPEKVPWRRLLAAAVRGALAEASGMVDYTFVRPSRRTAWGAPVILPSLRAPRPRVVVVIDTSGSMSELALADSCREVRGILRAAGAEGVRAVAVDAAVAAAGRVFSARQLAPLLRGGGGTDMGAGLAEAEKHRPDVTVVLTDGETPWPDEKPRCGRVVVALVESPEESEWEAPEWATVVRVEK
jgi:predicted metal-dependent peptidase